jgi:hypothetical protein
MSSFGGPSINGGGGGGSGTMDHHELTNLTNYDDHSQYIHTSNTRTVSAVHIIENGLSFGLNPATTGLIRLPNNSALYARDNTNSSDKSLIKLNTSDQTEVGDGYSILDVSTTGIDFISSLFNPIIRQSLDSTNSITADTLAVQAQNATGLNAIGGKLLLQSGTGTSRDGYIEVQSGTTQRVLIDSYGVYVRSISQPTINREDGGNISFPSWDDLQGDISQGTANTVLTYEAYRDTPFKCYFWRHDQNDELNFVYQMPHSWNNGTVIPHLHVVPMSNGAGNFVVDGYYVWAPLDGYVNALSSWTAISPITTAIAASDQYKQRLINLGNLTPPTNISVMTSAILLIYLKRNVTLDTYETGKTGGTASANIALLSADLHYQKNKLGTFTSTG